MLLPAHKGFYFPAYRHRVTPVIAGYNYGAKLRIAPAGLLPASSAASLAAPRCGLTRQPRRIHDCPSQQRNPGRVPFEGHEPGPGSRRPLAGRRPRLHHLSDGGPDKAGEIPRDGGRHPATGHCLEKPSHEFPARDHRRCECVALLLEVSREFRPHGPDAIDAVARIDRPIPEGSPVRRKRPLQACRFPWRHGRLSARFQ